MKQAAVIILNYNGVHFLEQFLPSAVRYSQGHRLIVADNGSTDTSLTFLNMHYPEVEIMALGENYGYALGYDLALREIDNEYSILLNSDVEVTENWIEPVIEFMETDEQIAACQPKIRDFYRREYFEHAGAAGGFIDTLGYPFCRGRILNILEKDQGQYDDVRQIFWATGTAFFVRTNTYKEVEGFDANLHAHMEEIDLCWRINKAGYKIFCVPQSVVYHVGGGTMPASNPRKTYLNFRNSTVVLFKNSSKGVVWWKVGTKLMLDFIAATMFLLSGKKQDSRAVLKAMGHFFSNFRKWKQARNKTREMNPLEKPGTIYPGSLVINRYLLGKKFFSDFGF